MFVSHLSVWLMVSSDPGEVLLGETISAAVGGVLTGVIVWFWSGEFLKVSAGPQESDCPFSQASAPADTRAKVSLFIDYQYEVMWI